VRVAVVEESVIDVSRDIFETRHLHPENVVHSASKLS
jgi:hypothetical protein